MSKVRQALIALIYQTIPPAISGKVKSVDESNFTCVVSPSNGGPAYEDVRLNAAISNDDSGMISIPDVNSEVLIAPIQNNSHAYYVTRFSKVKKWSLKTVSGKFIEIVDTGGGKINVNGDQYGGIPRKSALETLADDIQTAISNAFTAVGAGVSSNGPAGAASWNTEITPKIAAFKNNLQNPNVKHG